MRTPPACTIAGVGAYGHNARVDTTTGADAPAPAAAGDEGWAGGAGLAPAGAGLPEPDVARALDCLSTPASRWFVSAFGTPTPAQAGAWQAISSGNHTLVVAPTGSGKTLAAFGWAVDRLLTGEPTTGCQVLYISPLKALITDVERNLAAPLAGIAATATELAVTTNVVTTGIRTGDTSASERRRQAAHPPHILATTPESLYLLLTSGAREGLRSVRTVIVDEVHAIAGTTRGSHLALSLERLDAITLDGPVQRIGLSATVHPVSTAASWLAGTRPLAEGGREVVVVQPPAAKDLDLRVEVPVPDMTAVDAVVEATTGELRRGLWPHVERRITQIVAGNRTTAVFANSRRGAERLTARLSEAYETADGADLPAAGAVSTADSPGQSGSTRGSTLPPDQRKVRTHHGSMSRAEREVTERALKAGTLPVVVATSSLELGIDIGTIDEVVQIGVPPSVASGLQRVGRSGHQVGATSRGTMIVMSRTELPAAAVLTTLMRRGRIEQLRIPRAPADVLAQQVVAMVATGDWDVEELWRTVRRAAPYAELSRPAFEGVLDMLSGRYPSEDFAELRARLTWDRRHGRLSALPGAALLAVTNGGTIPDSGNFGVYLDEPSGSDVVADKVTGGRRVGELDEQMVFESRVGDTITLGSSTWRIEQITTDRVIVSPAPGAPGRLPFWVGDTPGRPAQLGWAIGGWLRAVSDADEATTDGLVADAGLSDDAATNLMTLLDEQRAATGGLATDTELVVEEVMDEVGEWRVIIHSPVGGRVLAPWALLIQQRLSARHGWDPHAQSSDDGIVLRTPSVQRPDTTTGPAITTAELFWDPATVADELARAVGTSPRFAARFREASARALLLPRRNPSQRNALWRQRHRSAALLAVAADHPGFPMVVEAARAVLGEDFDVAELCTLMARIADGSVRVVTARTTRPSPMAQPLLSGYTASFMYDEDAPMAERRAAALSLDASAISALLGDDALAVWELLDPAVTSEVTAELADTTTDRQARSLTDVERLIRRHGPVQHGELAAMTAPETADHLDGWLDELAGAGRIVSVGVTPGGASAPVRHWIVSHDYARVRDGIGAVMPPAPDPSSAEAVPDPLGDLIRRYARTHGPFTAADVAHRLGLPVGVITTTAEQLVVAGHLVTARLIAGEPGRQLCDPAVLARLRRRSLAAAREQVRPVPATTMAVFAPRWHGVSSPVTPPTPQRGLARAREQRDAAIDQLVGVRLPWGAWTSVVMAARVQHWDVQLLTEVIASGEVLWCGHGQLPGGDLLISLHRPDTADLTLPPADEQPSGALPEAIVQVLRAGGAFTVAALVGRAGEILDAPVAATEVVAALHDLAAAGIVTADVVELPGPSRASQPAQATATRPRRLSLRPGAPVGLSSRQWAGRWWLLPARSEDTAARAHASAVELLERHGVLTRAVAASEHVGRELRAVLRTLGDLEQAGHIRRGYFVAGLGATQFAQLPAVESLRAAAAEQDAPEAVLLAAMDPANPFGATIGWPATSSAGTGASGHRPGRKPGAHVVIVGGSLVAYVERGGRTMLTFTDDGELLRAAGAAMVAATARGWWERPTITTIDNETIPGPAVSGAAARALVSMGFALTPRGLRPPAARESGTPRN